MSSVRLLLSRWRASRGDESGFTLIEMVVAVSLLAILLPVFAVTIVGTTNAGGDARLRQIATALAETGLDSARSVSAATMSTGATAAGTPPAGVDLSATTGPVILTTQSVALDGHTFTTRLYAGSCYLQTAGPSSGQCTTTASSYPMERAIAYVTWNAPTGCGTACTYVTSTLLATSNSDPTVNINPDSTPPAPIGLSASVSYLCRDQQIRRQCPNEMSAIMTFSWTASNPTGTQQAVTGYLVTATPTGGVASTCTSDASTTSCAISGAPTGASYSAIVQADSSAGYSPPSTAVMVNT